MTRDEAIAEIKLGLGFRTDLSTQAAMQLVHAQAYFERQWPDPSNLPWFLITEREVANTVPNDERVAKPDDWLGDVEDDGLWIMNDEGEEILLSKKPIDNLRQLYTGIDPGFPSAYGFDGYYYRLFPRPDNIYGLRMQYYQQDTVLSGGTDENKWLKEAPDILIGRAGAVLAGAGGNSRADLFIQRMQGAIASVNSKSIWLKELNATPAMNQTA